MEDCVILLVFERLMFPLLKTTEGNNHILLPTVVKMCNPGTVRRSPSVLCYSSWLYLVGGMRAGSRCLCVTDGLVPIGKCDHIYPETGVCNSLCLFERVAERGSNIWTAVRQWLRSSAHSDMQAAKHLKNSSSSASFFPTHLKCPCDLIGGHLKEFCGLGGWVRPCVQWKLLNVQLFSFPSGHQRNEPQSYTQKIKHARTIKAAQTFVQEKLHFWFTFFP